ncbi:hypothetical protein NRK67_14295 [Fusobacteria bacterium ZRK30]|nr:hypothetical protein NRK67_14295 [Fusobacteria bacterium ZRK30]
MEYTANLRVDLKEIKIIRTLIEVEINSNKLLKQLLKKVQLGEINILEDSLEILIKKKEVLTFLVNTSFLFL